MERLWQMKQREVIAKERNNKSMRRRWITFLRICRYGLNNFSRNAWLSMAATVVMVVTLTVVITTFTARMVFDDTLGGIREKIDVSVYLSDNITPEQQQKLEDAIKAVPIVTSIEHITKDQAREIFKQQNKDYFSQLEALGELGDINPFPASLRVKTSDPDKLSLINDVVSKPEFKDAQSEPASISGQRKEAIDNIAKAASFSEVVGLAASGVFLVLSIMIIFNTIRMAIFNRRDEIEIMKLIGAEKRFIKGPFIVEASLYGVFAAIISVALIYLVLLTAAPQLANYDIQIGPTITFFTQWPGLIFLAQLAVGVIIGILSSQMALRRYLKV
jgi:cell division transport system permease protein